MKESCTHTMRRVDEGLGAWLTFLSPFFEMHAGNHNHHRKDKHNNHDHPDHNGDHNDQCSWGFCIGKSQETKTH